MRKLIRNKKGLSPVVATVLLILVVMVGMTILFAFVDAYATNFQAGSGSGILESMTIEDVWFTSNTGHNDLIQLWVYNVGKVSFTINSVYVNGAPPASITSNSKVVQIGTHCEINVTLSADWTNANNYELKIVTARGSAFEGRYSPQN